MSAPKAVSISTHSALAPGTELSNVLHTSQLSLLSTAGTHEQFLDSNSDLVADQRTTFDADGGSFDIAVGHSGVRYEAYSATLNSTPVGVLMVGLDTNGDFQRDTSITYNLYADFQMPSAAAVVAGTSRAGWEFVIVSSSGYYNSADPDDPKNEQSPGIVLLVRDVATGAFNNAMSRVLVTVGDNRLYNANALALLPNNDLLVADFHFNELRIIRDTNDDGLPDTLDAVPYYSYSFADDAPLDIATNSRGVVFSHSAGDATVLLAIYDEDRDGRGDYDKVVVQGLSIDNNLVLHGLSVDRVGNVYIIEDATSIFDDGNGGVPRIDAFPDKNLDGFLGEGAIFAEADNGVSLALSGLALAFTRPNPINGTNFFVRQQYGDFLNREPDSGGLAYWVNEITSCGNNLRCLTSRRTGVSAAFFVEQEFQTTGYFVYRLYSGGLGRRPTYEEFLQDRTTIKVEDLEATRHTLALAFVQRSPFVQKYSNSLTAISFAEALIANILQNSNVNLSHLRTALIDSYNQGSTLSLSRALALRKAIEDSEFAGAEYNASFVLMQYFGYLRRDAETSGFEFWLNVLNKREPNNYRGMVCGFITSREYQERFGKQLLRSNADCQE